MSRRYRAVVEWNGSEGELQGWIVQNRQRRFTITDVEDITPKHRSDAELLDALEDGWGKRVGLERNAPSANTIYAVDAILDERRARQENSS